MQPARPVSAVVELLLSRQPWFDRVVEQDGDIYLRIDGTYAEGLRRVMLDWWRDVLHAGDVA